MSTQEGLVAVTAAAAAVYLLWTYGRSWWRRGCGSDCGCAGKAGDPPTGTLISSADLTDRVKRHRSQR